jgi:hypothetical protein
MNKKITTTAPLDLNEAPVQERKDVAFDKVLDVDFHICDRTPVHHIHNKKD